MFNLKKESPIPPRSKEPSVRGLLEQKNMKINIWQIKIPSNYEKVEEIKELIGNSRVKAYSIDLSDNSVIEGQGWIASNESYNYHNNYDDSKDCMWFNEKQQWFTLNLERVLNIQKENNKVIIERLEPIINLAKSNI